MKTSEVTVRSKSGKIYTYSYKFTKKGYVGKRERVDSLDKPSRICTPENLTPYALRLVNSIERAKFDGANDHKELIRIAGATRR